MGARIWTLIAIDVLFILGLLVLIFLGGGDELWPIVSCIGLIASITWSIVQLRDKAKAPPAAPE
jgi:hypothetical protein